MTTLLILDSDLHVRALLAQHCAAHGYRVLQDATGTAGLTLVLTFTPHVVLVDRTLADIDGLAFAQRLRMLPFIPQPILYLLGMDQRAALIDVEQRETFPKPLDVAQVLTRLLQDAPPAGDALRHQTRGML